MLDADDIQMPDHEPDDNGHDGYAAVAGYRAGADDGRPLPHTLDELLRALRMPAGAWHATGVRKAAATTGQADPMHRTLGDVVRQAACHVGELFERRVDRGDVGMELLFAGTGALQVFAERELAVIRGPIVDTFPQVTFACCTDVRGVLPFEHDDSPYQVSAPIHVHGCHWGAFRIGYRPPAPAAPPLGARPDTGWTT